MPSCKHYNISFKKFSVLGWSNGGVSATILAALYPELVKKSFGAKVLPQRKDNIELFEKKRDAYVSNWSQ